MCSSGVSLRITVGSTSRRLARASVGTRRPWPPLPAPWLHLGATYHTTLDPGILSSVRPPSSHPSSIMVANGSCLPAMFVGAAGAHGSFRLPNILVAPSMVHNFLSIRKFTTDNYCSIEFDSSGLTVKDLASRRPLLRCDSTGPFYTLRFPHASSSSLLLCQLLSPPPLAPLFGTVVSAILVVMP